MSTEELEFSAATHQYFFKGRELLSVTTAFEKVGITDFSRVPFDIIEPARVLGDMVHEIAMYYGLGVLDEDSVDPSLGGYLEGIKKFFKAEVKQVIAIEQPVFSLTHGYAGTFDIVYEGHKGLIRLDDFKSSVKPHVACKWQTSAYAYAYEKMHKVRIGARRGVHFTKGGEYLFDAHGDVLRRDFDEFLSILKVAILKKQNKIK